MNKIILVIAVILSFTLKVNGQWSKSKAMNAVQQWIDQNDSLFTLKIAPNELWKIQCPIGVVCDENYDYRMFILKDGPNTYTLSFNPQLAKGITLEKLNEHVKYFTMHFSPLQLEKQGWEVWAQANNQVKRSEISFSKWENGMATMNLEWSFNEIQLINMHDKECIESYSIEDSSVKEGCIVNLKTEIKVKIEISARMEDQRVIDNRNVDW